MLARLSPRNSASSWTKAPSTSNGRRLPARCSLNDASTTPCTVLPRIDSSSLGEIEAGPSPRVSETARRAEEAAQRRAAEQRAMDDTLRKPVDLQEQQARYKEALERRLQAFSRVDATAIDTAELSKLIQEAQRASVSAATISAARDVLSRALAARQEIEQPLTPPPSSRLRGGETSHRGEAPSKGPTWSSSLFFSEELAKDRLQAHASIVDASGSATPRRAQQQTGSEAPRKAKNSSRPAVHREYIFLSNDSSREAALELKLLAACENAKDAKLAASQVLTEELPNAAKGDQFEWHKQLSLATELAVLGLQDEPGPEEVQSRRTDFAERLWHWSEECKKKAETALVKFEEDRLQALLSLTRFEAELLLQAQPAPQLEGPQTTLANDVLSAVDSTRRAIDETKVPSARREAVTASIATIEDLHRRLRKAISAGKKTESHVDFAVADSAYVKAVQAVHRTRETAEDHETLIQWAVASMRETYAQAAVLVKSISYFTLGKPVGHSSFSALAPSLFIVTPLHMWRPEVEDTVLPEHAKGSVATHGANLLFADAVEVRFLCGYDLQPVEPPVIIQDASTFVMDIAPALAMNLHVLERALQNGWVRASRSKLGAYLPPREGESLLERVKALHMQTDAALAALTGTMEFAPVLAEAFDTMVRSRGALDAAMFGSEMVVTVREKSTAAFDVLAQAAHDQGVLDVLPMVPIVGEDGVLSWVHESNLLKWQQINPSSLPRAKDSIRRKRSNWLGDRWHDMIAGLQEASSRLLVPAKRCLACTSERKTEVTAHQQVGQPIELKLLRVAAGADSTISREAALEAELRTACAGAGDVEVAASRVLSAALPDLAQFDPAAWGRQLALAIELASLDARVAGGDQAASTLRTDVAQQLWIVSEELKDEIEQTVLRLEEQRLRMLLARAQLEVEHAHFGGDVPQARLDAAQQLLLALDEVPTDEVINVFRRLEASGSCVQLDYALQSSIWFAVAEPSATAVRQQLDGARAAFRDNQTIIHWAELRLCEAYAEISHCIRSIGFFLIGDPDSPPSDPLAIECPFLIIASPAGGTSDSGTKAPASTDTGGHMWMFAGPVEVRFLCGYDLQPVEPPVIIQDASTFVMDIAPALAMSLRMLERALQNGWVRPSRSKLGAYLQSREGESLPEQLKALQMQTDAALAALTGSLEFAPVLAEAFDTMVRSRGALDTAVFGSEMVATINEKSTAAFSALAQAAKEQGVLDVLPMVPGVGEDGVLSWVHESNLHKWRQVACPSASRPLPFELDTQTNLAQPRRSCWSYAEHFISQGRERLAGACIECFAADEHRRFEELMEANRLYSEQIDMLSSQIVRLRRQLHAPMVRVRRTEEEDTNYGHVEVITTTSPDTRAKAAAPPLADLRSHDESPLKVPEVQTPADIVQFV
ncbi:hypothetical protein AB1Y20_015836 [Prymnesium parvum]|uniref:Uncharacterized protein n=1 Tax=Prymnesium parvum TaxID=97485 RepID=A0AB34K261_PRYPA